MKPIGIGDFLRIKDCDDEEYEYFICIVESIDKDADGLIGAYNVEPSNGTFRICSEVFWTDVGLPTEDAAILLNNFGKMTIHEFSKKHPEYLV